MYARLTLTDLSKEMCMELVKCAIKGQNPMTIGVKSKTICIEDVKNAETERVTSVIPITFRSLEEMKFVEDSKSNPKKISKRDSKADSVDNSDEDACNGRIVRFEDDYKLVEKLCGAKFSEIAEHTSDVNERFEEFFDWYCSVTGVRKTAHTKENMKKILVDLPIEASNSNKIVTYNYMIDHLSRAIWTYMSKLIKAFITELHGTDSFQKKFSNFEFVRYYNDKLNVIAEPADTAETVAENTNIAE